MTCKIEKCDKSALTKKWQLCSGHDARRKRYGNPEAGFYTKSGQTSHPMYRAYRKMLDRCSNPKDAEERYWHVAQV